MSCLFTKGRFTTKVGNKTFKYEQGQVIDKAHIDRLYAALWTKCSTILFPSEECILNSAIARATAAHKWFLRSSQLDRTIY